MRELSLNVLDLAQNSLTAGAKLTEIHVLEDTAADLLEITLKDDGKGMTSEQVQRVTDPFYTTRTTRKVGLGIPLFQMAAEQTGGNLVITSAVGVGTTVTARFHPSAVRKTAQPSPWTPASSARCWGQRFPSIPQTSWSGLRPTSRNRPTSSLEVQHQNEILS